MYKLFKFRKKQCIYYLDISLNIYLRTKLKRIKFFTNNSVLRIVKREWFVCRVRSNKPRRVICFNVYIKQTGNQSFDKIVLCANYGRLLLIVPQCNVGAKFSKNLEKL